MSGIKNPDGTVNFEGMKTHLAHLKGKYEQNARNYEANTGKKMDFTGGEHEHADKDAKETAFTTTKDAHASKE